MQQKYKLTIPQSNIWLVENFYDDKSINVIAGTLNISKDFNIDYAKQTINKFCELNDATRIKFIKSGSNLFQYVEEYTPFDVVVKDISGLTEIEEKEFEKSIVDEPIDLFTNPFTLMVLDRKNGSGKFLLKCHHLLSDAWSVSLMGTDLASIYEKISVGDFSFEPRPSYINFINDEIKYLNSQKYIKDEEFWKEYLKDFDSPAFIKSKENFSTAANRYHKVFSSSFTKEIHDFCANNHVSIYSVFLSAIAIYLNRITQGNDIIIGTPVLNRSNFIQKQTQGMFISTVPVRFKIDSNKNFTDFCIETSLNSMNIFKHQKFPYSKILKETSHNQENLFNIAFSYQNARSKIDLSKYNIEWIFSGKIQSEIEFHLLDLNDSGNLEFDIDYLTDLFSADEIEYLYRRIIALINDGIKNNPKISNIKIMDNYEKELILNNLNNTFSKYESDKSIIEIFKEIASSNPNSIALIFKNNSMTYSELDNKSDIIANYLLSKNIGKRDRIGIFIDKSFELIIAILGVLKVGATYIPIDSNYTDERKNFILNESNVKLCITDCLSLKYNYINVYEILKNNIYTNLLNNNNKLYDDPLQPVCILYTSGTTGKPKGVEITNRNVIKLVRNISYMDFDNTARILQVASIVFDLSIFEIWASLLNGQALCLTTKNDFFNFTYLKDYIDKNHINIMCLTSVVFNQIVSNHIDVLENVKQILTGGDKISIEHVKVLKNKYPNIKIYNSYGPTECTSFCTMYEITNTDAPIIYIGKPISNSCCYILDNNNKILPFYSIGELAIGGDGVSNGYINNSQKNKECFIKNTFSNKFLSDKLYKTGDLARIYPDGNIEFIGRKDNQVKIRGYRIELDEIKNHVLTFPGIENCAVLIKEDNVNHSNKHIYLYIVSNTKKIDIDEFKKYLSKNLPIYMIPSAIMQIDKLPINSNYKVDYTKLPDISVIKSSENVKKPYSKIQKDLYEFIKHLLKIKCFSIDDNLFNIGLDSLFAIELSNYIFEHYKVNISTKNILENNTITLLEEYINSSEKEDISSDSIENTNTEILVSSGETSIFLDSLKDNSSTLYNAPFELKLSKNIDINFLQKCIIDTINNNKNMRATFHLENNTIKKEFDLNTDIKIPINTVSLNEYKNIKEHFVKSFDISRFPLFRIEIYITRDNVYVLADIHHIIFDGSSFLLFMNELSKRYNRLYENSVSKNNITNTQVSKSLMAKSKEFFLNEFSGELPVNDLPYDKPRGKSRTFNGLQINNYFDTQTTLRINSYIKKYNFTLNSLFQSAFSILLAKYSYNEDIIFGFAYSGRDNKIIENEIGMYVRTIPYRVSIDWNTKIKDFIKFTQLKTLDYIQYSNYSLDNLVKDIDLPRINNRNVLFDVMFVCQNMHINKFLLGDSIVQYSAIPRSTSKFDFTFEVIPSDNKIELNLEYNSDLFRENHMESLLKHFKSIVTEMITKESSVLKDIDMILDEEKDIIINKYNDNKTNFPKKTVSQLFEEQVIKNPNKKAVVFGNKYLTYDELNKKANKIARFLIKNNLKPNQVVSIMIDKSLDYMPAAIAVLKCRAAYTPIIQDLPDERAKYMIENAKSSFILTTKEFYRNISNTKTIFLDDESNFNMFDDSNLNLDYNIDDMLHIIYTSGSTGVPKGNMIKNRGMVRLLLDTNYVNYSSSDVMVTSASLTFDISGFELWGAMLYGMTLHILTKEQIMNINYYSDYLLKNKITTTFLATPIFHLMVEENASMFKNMKSIYVGGETLLPKYTNMLYKINKNVKVYNAYGPAEITVICCAMLIDRLYETYEDIPLGKIASNNTVLVLDKCQKLCPVNVPGELYIWGDGLGLGYVNRDDLTKEKFTYIDGYSGLSYRSGDLTKWNDYGEIRFISRIDTQVKIRGQRIELSEIQNKILEIPQIKEAVVIVKEYNNSKYIIAYYTLNNKIKNTEIKDYLVKYLPDYMIPYRMIELSSIPYTHNGKIDRRKLPEINLSEKIDKEENLNKNQLLIKNIFENILENISINMNSNFFEVGGDSLAAARLVAELQANNIYVSYGDIFKYPTPMELYKHIYLNKFNSIASGKIYKDTDFDDIHAIIKEKLYHNENINLYKKIGNVLLTGVTGFLGVHILKELVYNSKVNKIYCLIRDKNNLSSKERFKKQLEFFFEKNTVNDILKKAVVVNGDITNTNLFVSDFKENIDLIINAAARVKHYGDYNKFYDVNVLGVKNLINYCIKNNTKLVHISTLSVSGNILEAGQTKKQEFSNKIFSEENLYIGQNIENVYVNTKFAAEVEILESVIKNNLNAKILRVGNLTGRLSDGKFQPNVEDNAFSNRVKTLISIKAMPQSMYKKYIEMTPIDVVSKAICKIIEISNTNIIYHLFNHNHLQMHYVVNILKQINININILDNNEFTKLLHTLMSDKNKLPLVQGIIPDIAEDGSLEYNDTIKIKSDISQNILKEVCFEWPIIDKEYFFKYLKYLDKINFLNLTEDKNE